MGGDPTTGMTTPWRDSFNIDTDGDGVNDAQDVEPNDPAVPNPPAPPDGASGSSVESQDDQMPEWDPDTPLHDDSATAAIEVEPPSFAEESSFVEEPAYVEESTYDAPSGGGLADGTGTEWADG